MNKLSIAIRLTCWFSAIFLVGFIVFGVVMWLDLAWQLSEGRDRTLARRGARLYDLLQATEGQSASERALRYQQFADATPEGNLVHLYGENGVRIYPLVVSPPDFPFPAEVLPGNGDRSREVAYSERHYRVLLHPVTLGKRTLTILVAGQLEDNRQLLARFGTGLQAATPVLLIVSALAGYFLSRRALGPIDGLTMAVRSISIGNLSGRLPIHNTGDELQRLAETSNEMLARLESAVGRINRFTADASHELRSPISFMRTVAEYSLQNPHLDPESRRGFEEILAESVEAGRLLEDMLTLARADAGRSEITLAPVDLGELLLSVCGKARAAAIEKRQNLIVHAATASTIEIQGDWSKLGRLFWTLLDNAIKYTAAEGQIEVALERNGAQAKVSIRDSGIGIPKEALPHVFERFFRTDSARDHADGTGLGLAIAKWIADAHHATLTAESKDGQGTVFVVLFPTAG